MARSHLSQLRERDGFRAGTIHYWWRNHQDELLETARRYSRDAAAADDAFAQTVEELLTKNSPSIVAAVGKVSEHDADDLTFLAKKICKQRAVGHGGEREVSFDPLAHDDSDDAAGPLESATYNHDRRVVFDLFKTVFTSEVSRENFILHFVEEWSFTKIAALRGVTRKAISKNVERSQRNFALALQSLESGAICAEFRPLVSRASVGHPLNDAESSQLATHIAHCSGCRVELAEQRQAVRGAAIFFPLPMAAAGWGGSMLEGIQAGWSNLFGRGSELVASAWSSPTAHTVKPIAAVSAAVALVAGGTAAVVEEQRAAQAQTPAAETRPGPRSLLDPIEPAPAPKPKKRKKKREPNAPKQSAPAPQPAPAPSPEPAPAPVDDGSSEFLPEAR